MLIEIGLKTSKREILIDITNLINDEIKKSKISSGISLVYTPHTTSAITINENADPDVCTDILKGLKDISPVKSSYLHGEGNSDAHIKASLFGMSQMIIIEEGRLKLGTWQGIYFCEFDGPRNRKIWLKIIKD
ncbi:MAG: secondary thiamine-phosphate synthase enzyme YjbQ [Endomicrobia bacterium]|nr:secondary thiamine-phosphate synthase enzyme YjbQ [Endomicrobiia bacterium]